VSDAPRVIPDFCYRNISLPLENVLIIAPYNKWDDHIQIHCPTYCDFDIEISIVVIQERPKHSRHSQNKRIAHIQDNQMKPVRATTKTRERLERTHFAYSSSGIKGQGDFEWSISLLLVHLSNNQNK
jgi:hypothetical protein